MSNDSFIAFNKYCKINTAVNFEQISISSFRTQEQIDKMQRILIGVRKKENICLYRMSLACDSREEFHETINEHFLAKVSSYYTHLVTFYEDDMLPLLLFIFFEGVPHRE